MKKLIFLALILFSTSIFSQTSKFLKFQSTADLQNEFSKINDKEKREYYFRYLKLAEVESLSKNPAFKHFSKDLLLTLVEEMYGENVEEDCFNCTDENKEILAENIIKVDKQILEKENVEVGDLEQIYNPSGYNSGSTIVDLSTEKNIITFTKTNGLGEGTFTYIYKVKKNKLKLVDSYVHSK